MKNKINFIYFGRFTKEKWFDLVLEILEKYQKNYKANFWIFGKWEKKFENRIKELDKISNNIEYFAWKKQKIIQNYISKSDYCLMPSRFLETFGLSALESISEWVPVIWFAKWWLKQFIWEEFNIDRQNWQSDFEKFDKVINKIIENYNYEKYKKISNKMKEKSENYSKKDWLSNFKKISKGKKILMISDYIENIWWIENYISDTTKLLQQNWYEVDKFWLNGKIVKYRKLLMPLVWLNIIEYFKLNKKIKKFDPDIIWIHSASRYLWWLPLLNCKWKNTFMMYHDLWYFHPYPSKVCEEEQILNFWFINFIKQAKIKNPFKFISVSLKFLSIWILKKILLKVVKKHIVPSEFMKKYLIKWWVDSQKIMELKHFKIF